MSEWALAPQQDARAARLNCPSWTIAPRWPPTAGGGLLYPDGPSAWCPGGAAMLGEWRVTVRWVIRLQPADRTWMSAEARTVADLEEQLA